MKALQPALKGPRMPRFSSAAVIKAAGEDRGCLIYTCRSQSINKKSQDRNPSRNLKFNHG